MTLRKLSLYSRRLRFYVPCGTHLRLAAFFSSITPLFFSLSLAHCQRDVGSVATGGGTASESIVNSENSVASESSVAGVTGVTGESTANSGNSGNPAAGLVAPTKNSVPSSAPDGRRAVIRPEDLGRQVSFSDLEMGGGAMVTAGRQVELHYVMHIVGGKVIEDSHSMDGGHPRQLQLGEGKMLPAMEAGIVGMRPGGRRRILIPSILAFGHGGVGSQVPPDSDLEVEVEVFKVYD